MGAVIVSGVNTRPLAPTWTIWVCCARVIEMSELMAVVMERRMV